MFFNGREWEFKKLLNASMEEKNKKKDELKRGLASFKIFWRNNYPGLDLENKKTFRYIKKARALMEATNRA